jgi:hypothetical protein
MGMAQQIINVGSSPNDGAGDPIRTAFIKTNTNFTQLFALPNPTPPATLVGKAGDVPGMYAYNSSYFYYCFGTYNGSTVIWAQVAQIGNVTVSNIINGTSNVRIASANANVIVSVNGTSNVAVFNPTGLIVPGNISTSNITADHFIGNGSQLTNLPIVYGNANVANFLPIFTGNITSNTMCAVGNVRAGNFRTAGEITAVGNVYGNVVVGTYLYGDGSNISNISGGGGGNYSNANVQAFLPVYSGNILLSGMSVTGNISAAGNIRGGNLKTAGEISAAGNVIGSYILGDGSQLTGIPASYTDANVAAFLPTYTGNLSVAAINITGNIIPTANAVYSLGNATNQWANLYVSNSSIHIGNQVLTTYAGNLFFNDNLVFTGSGTSSNITANVSGTTTGLHNGLVNSFDIKALSWDFGYITANTYTNPIQYLFSVTSAGNIDMGTCVAPAALYIDIGTINASTVN